MYKVSAASQYSRLAETIKTIRGHIHDKGLGAEPDSITKKLYHEGESGILFFKDRGLLMQIQPLFRADFNRLLQMEKKADAVVDEGQTTKHEITLFSLTDSLLQETGLPDKAALEPERPLSD